MHLLCGSRLLSLPDHLTYHHPLGDEDFEITPAQAARRVKHLNNVLNHFWRCWRQEYLLELRECHRYSRGKESAPTVEVGDVVLLYDDALPRKLARVQELITGRDGKPRGAVPSFPGCARSSLTVRNSLRGPGLVHHVMSATFVFLRHQITFAVLPILVYTCIRKFQVETSQACTIDYSCKL